MCKLVDQLINMDVFQKWCYLRVHRESCREMRSHKRIVIVSGELERVCRVGGAASHMRRGMLRFSRVMIQHTTYRSAVSMQNKQTGGGGGLSAQYVTNFALQLLLKFRRHSIRLVDVQVVCGRLAIRGPNQETLSVCENVSLSLEIPIPAAGEYVCVGSVCPTTAILRQSHGPTVCRCFTENVYLGGVYPAVLRCFTENVYVGSICPTVLSCFNDNVYFGGDCPTV